MLLAAMAVTAGARDLRRWTPALRRAVIAVSPDFFAWSLEEQERFAAHLSHDDRETLDRVLLEELFGIAVESDDGGLLTLDELDHVELNLFNAAALPLFGIGKDCFFLNEHFAEGDSLLEYATVAAWDRSDFELQEEARRKEDPAYEGRPYRGALDHAWARLFVGEDLVYANLTMVAGYLRSAVEEHGSDLIDTLVPHRYVPGKEHGRRVGQGFQWDMRPDAGGREPLLEELQHRHYDYLGDRYEALSASWDAEALGAVYLVERFEDSDRCLDVLFADRAALEAVRFRSFLDDCRTLERPAPELTPHVDTEKAAVEAFLHRTLEDLEAHWDPALVRFKRRRKVVLAPGVAEDLL